MNRTLSDSHSRGGRLFSRGKFTEVPVGKADRHGDFFASYKLPKTITVTTLLLFDHVTLLCGTFLFIKLRE